MKFCLRIAYALIIVLANSALSALAIPLGNSFCLIPNSAGEDFAGYFLMVNVAKFSLIAGCIIAALILLNAWRKDLAILRTLANVTVGILALPLLSLSYSVAYHYDTCPGYGRSLTPEQMENIRHG
jgi:hypothetical protein